MLEPSRGTQPGWASYEQRQVQFAVSNIEQAGERFSLMLMLPCNKGEVADSHIHTEECAVY